MSKHKIVYLPLDERPCNYKFACEIAQGSPISVIAPPIEILGDKKIPAQYSLLKEFLLSNADADSAVISLDMLLYGGIVPSRLHNLTKEELVSRLDLLAELKRRNPKITIYAFALIMRCPSYSSDDEEPSYYQTCGREIFLTGQTKHKLQLGLISQDEAQQTLNQYQKVIGDNLSDYENRRKLNRDMLLETANLIGQTIDYFVIPQDDSAPYGYTSMDREYIKQAAGKKLANVPTYPGADEVGMTLIARAACNFAKRTPKIFCIYAHPNSPSVIPLYEDRPLNQTLPFQVQTAGCVFAPDQSSADILLYLNYPSSQPVDIWQDKTIGYENRDLPAFCDKIVQGLNKVVAIADGAYANGGDAEFIKILAQKTDLFKLSAYAGWNTSSNTLGTAICQAVFVYLFGKTPQQDEFLAKRFFEDLGYCAYVRAYVTENLLTDLGYNYFNAGQKDGVVAQLVKENLQKYMSQNFPQITHDYKIVDCQLPWKRMFEVDITVKK